MPEEKVKQYECLCPCEHETGCIACENGNHDYHLVPPAADAGPRQELCQNCHQANPVWFAPNNVWNAVVSEISGILCPVCFINRAERQGFECTGWQLIPENEPPVPQEAAPRLCTNCKEESWTHCRFHEPAHCHVECAQGTVPPWPTEQYPPRCKRVEPATAPDEAMRVARHFHETYERLAPQFGYETRKESAKPWADVPERNRNLMTAVCAEILTHAAAQLAEKEREIERLNADLNKVISVSNDHFLRAEAAEQRLQEAQAQIKELEFKFRIAR